MSSRYVRTKVRDWLNQGTIPFVDTVNLEADPQSDMWSTLDWTYSNRTVESYCGTYLEEGTFTIAFFGRPGIGDDALLAAVEADTALLMSRVDTSGKLVLLDFEPPMDYREAESFVVEVMVSYEYRT